MAELPPSFTDEQVQETLQSLLGEDYLVYSPVSTSDEWMAFLGAIDEALRTNSDTLREAVQAAYTTEIASGLERSGVVRGGSGEAFDGDEMDNEVGEGQSAEEVVEFKYEDFSLIDWGLDPRRQDAVGDLITSFGDDLVLKSQLAGLASIGDTELDAQLNKIVSSAKYDASQVTITEPVWEAVLAYAATTGVDMAGFVGLTEKEWEPLGSKNKAELFVRNGGFSNERAANLLFEVQGVDLIAKIGIRDPETGRVYDVAPGRYQDYVDDYGETTIARAVAAFKKNGLEERFAPMVVDEFLSDPDMLELYERHLERRTIDSANPSKVENQQVQELINWFELSEAVALRKEQGMSEGMAITSVLAPDVANKLLNERSNQFFTEEQREAARSMAKFFPVESAERAYLWNSEIFVMRDGDSLTQGEREHAERLYFRATGRRPNEQQKKKLFDAYADRSNQSERDRAAENNPFGPGSVGNRPMTPAGEFTGGTILEATDAWGSLHSPRSQGGMRPDHIGLTDWWDLQSQQLIREFGPMAQGWIHGRNRFAETGSPMSALMDAYVNGEISEELLNGILREYEPV